MAFGPGTPQGRQALHVFDGMVRSRFPGFPVRWAFTSPLARERLASARQKSDSVGKALRRLQFERFSHVAIQPLQTIAGAEHEDVCAAASEAQRSGKMRCQVGLPLLAGPEDIEATAHALARQLPPERKAGEDVIFVGHGARHPAGRRYADLATALKGLDASIHVGTIGGALTLESILPRLASARVWLLPLLSVIGQHALRDMAGADARSWRSRIEEENRSCLAVLRGMAEYPDLSELWLAHLEAAVKEISGTEMAHEKRGGLCRQN